MWLTYSLIPNRGPPWGGEATLGSMQVDGLQSATLTLSELKIFRYLPVPEHMAGVGSGCRKLFSNPRQGGRAGVVGVPAGGWPCSHRPCSCSSRNVQRPPAWWQRSSTSAAAAASSSGSSESSSSFTTLRPKPNIPQIWLLGFLNTCIYMPHFLFVLVL